MNFANMMSCRRANREFIAIRQDPAAETLAAHWKDAIPASRRLIDGAIQSPTKAARTPARRWA